MDVNARFALRIKCGNQTALSGTVAHALYRTRQNRKPAKFIRRDGDVLEIALRTVDDVPIFPGKHPDNLRYDEASKRVFVGFGEDDGGIAMVDPKTDERVGDVHKTEGHRESFQVEASGGHIFDNVPDAGNVVESIDRKTGAVTKWALEGACANYPLAFSEEDHRLLPLLASLRC